jgi:hypothetical protein
LNAARTPKREHTPGLVRPLGRKNKMRRLHAPGSNAPGLACMEHALHGHARLACIAWPCEARSGQPYATALHMPWPCTCAGTWTLSYLPERLHTEALRWSLMCRGTAWPRASLRTPCIMCWLPASAALHTEALRRPFRRRGTAACSPRAR